MLFERKLKTAESRLFCFFSHVAEMQGTYELMHNGYRTEWKAILYEIICALDALQLRTSSPRQLDLKSQVSRQTKIARHEVQWPFYYTFFWNRKIQSPRYK